MGGRVVDAFTSGSDGGATVVVLGVERGLVIRDQHNTYTHTHTHTERNTQTKRRRGCTP